MTQTDTRLMAFVLGILADDENEKLEQELALSAQLRDQLSKAENEIKALEKNEPMMHPSPKVRESLLRSLGVDTPSEGLIDRLGKLFDLQTQRIREILTLSNDPGNSPWIASHIPGVSLLHFEGGQAVSKADCGLVYLSTGAVFPKHCHHGDEWALIIKGCIAEQSESEQDHRTFYTGDLAFSAAGSTHALQVVGDEPVLLAIVNHADIQLIP